MTTSSKHMIECPACMGECVLEEDGEGFPGGECPTCDGVGEVHEDPRLEGRTTCAVCNRTYTWGCGHSSEQESAMLDHFDTTEHLLGDCDCFVSRPGYAARFTRDEWRDRVADALRVERDEGGDLWKSLFASLFA